MPDQLIPPFSARNRGANSQIDQDFPKSARNGLLHLFHDWIGKRYVTDWISLAREGNRIMRYPPVNYDPTSVPSERAARGRVEGLIETMPWDKVIDLIESAYKNLAESVEGETNGYNWAMDVDSVRRKIADQVQNLFWEESLALEFKDGVASRRGMHHSKELIARAEMVLGDPLLISASQHYQKALRYFRQTSNPDLENAVKEAVCAIEAAGKALFPDQTPQTLDDVIKSLVKSEKVPRTIAKTFDGVYGFRNSGEGVSHGGATGGLVTIDLAEYVLAVAASQIILLVKLAEPEEPVPF